MKSYSKKIYIPSNKQEQQQYYKKQKFNCNVYQIGFDILQDKSKVAMGDPIFCQKCFASLNCFSQLEKKENSENDWTWKCEFCENQNNLVNFEEEEIPKQDDLCYVQQSNTKEQEGNTMVDSNDDISVIICTDFSGSMNVTQKLQNKNKLRINSQAIKELRSLKQFMEPQEYQQYKQIVIKEKNNYISRKDCVMAAIEQQIQEQSKKFPNRKFGLVTFNDEVTIIGDGVSGEEKIITGDKLYKFDQVLQESKSYASTHMQVPISESSQRLLEKFEDMQPQGKTALGPALLTCIGLLDNAKPGSQIIFCTDGLANIGFGALDNDEEVQSNEEIYNKLGELAIEKGIQISIITIKGESCKIQILGQLAQKTQGSITRVNPENIHNDFANILKEKVIATKVQLKVLMHKGLRLVNKTNENDLIVEENGFRKDVGNVTAKTTITFEYDIRTPEELQKLDIDLQKLKNLPFQGQIKYVTPEGHQMIRVLTKNQDVSANMKEIHSCADIDVIQTHQTHVNKTNALKGKFKDVKVQQNGYQQFLSENLSCNYYNSESQQQQIQNAMKREKQLQTLSEAREGVIYSKSVSTSNKQQQQLQKQPQQLQKNQLEQIPQQASFGGMDIMDIAPQPQNIMLQQQNDQAMINSDNNNNQEQNDDQEDDLDAALYNLK